MQSTNLAAAVSISDAVLPAATTGIELADVVVQTTVLWLEPPRRNYRVVTPVDS